MGMRVKEFCAGVLAHTILLRKKSNKVGALES